MRKVIACLFILILSLSCSQQYNVASLSGTFDGVEGRNRPLAKYVQLELNADNTFSLKKSMDLSLIEGRGEWTMLNDGTIEMRCDYNPAKNDVVKALQGGSYLEGTFKIRILSNNRLKLGDTILKRKK
ncbi:MAG: hypothetical protein IKR88_04405 [Bacteroidales bacterium]|nr:hypothetical protein [Bacteroidales bacterium]